MAQSTRRYQMVGDYMMGKQIGAGSFSTVWHARHLVHGTEVAIKEIVTSRLNPKLQESLKSEIFILKGIDHPNIIRLHDMIEESGKIYIILEYCKGGDLSIYIQQRQGRIMEETAKLFMQQLAEGLKVLRENNLIHRDLKPQNLLLSTDGDDCVLKIADFGFARSLQPRGLAETLCGSPLYMAPEIMQLQKYDAKADLWSVGAILFQLVTGKTPFTGNNQIELLQNIMRSSELQFPPKAGDLNNLCKDLCRKLLRRNPVERLTFEEFFNHPYLSRKQPNELLRNIPSQRTSDELSVSSRNAEQTSQEDCLPFSLDDELSSLTDGSPSPAPQRKATMKSFYGFSPQLVKDASNRVNKTDPSTYKNAEINFPSIGGRHFSDGNLMRDSFRTAKPKFIDTNKKVTDSLESIDQEGYVIVPGPLMDVPSSTQSKPLYAGNVGPTPNVPTVRGDFGYTGSVEGRLSAPEISQGSIDTTDALDKPSTDHMTRIGSLRQYATAITELVDDKVEAGKQLEAFSVQLVILAIWKQALHICHTHAASAVDGSWIQRSSLPEGGLEISSEIEGTFLHEVGRAEELAKIVEPGNMEMPDAMELLYQSALALGRHGAVDEYMGDVESAVLLYSNAARLLMFLLVEAPCLILNPTFSLTNSDRYRIKSYINLLNKRRTASGSHKSTLLNVGKHTHPS